MGEDSRADERDEQEPLDDDSPSDPTNELGASPRAWHAIPVWRLVVFATLGGGLYQAYWAYRCWQAYRASWGYSREPFWREVHAQSGYRPSAFWRGVLTSAYCYCLFPAVAREARAEGTTALPGPIALALAFGVVVGLSAFVLGPWSLLQALLLVPAQRSMNALSDHERGDAARTPVTAAELLCLMLGSAFTLTALWKAYLA
jgi:hypothetical protein